MVTDKDDGHHRHRPQPIRCTDLCRSCNVALRDLMDLMDLMDMPLDKPCMDNATL